MEKSIRWAQALPTSPSDPKPGTATTLPSAPGTRRRGLGKFFAHHLGALAAALLLADTRPATAGIAYGTLNNFDCVNDTGVEAHGFEIELDDVHSIDITYTYDYNHYGTPKIT